MKLPAAFNREYDRWRAGHDAAVRRAGERGSADIFDLKPSILEFQRLYARWHPRLLHNPQMLRPLETLARSFAASLEYEWLKQLHGVVHAIMRQRAAEEAIEALLGMIEDLQGASPEERAELEREHREKLGADFDPEKELAENEERAYEGEQLAESRLAGLTAAWPDRVNTPLRERLAALGYEAAHAWALELVEQGKALGKQEEPAASAESTAT